MSLESILIALAAIGVIGIACQWLAWWAKLPAILLLLLAGIALGPVTGWLDPDALFGDLLLPMVSLAVAAILFEGSLTLRFDEIRGLQQVVQRMVTGGLLVTWGVTTLAMHWLLGFSWELAFLFGAVTVVTGPTVIVPMLRTIRPNARLASILRWDGIVVDPVGALLADNNWDHIRTALMRGLQTYFGNPVSAQADRRLDLVGIGGLLALSPRAELNALAGLRYRAEFGTQNIYTLAEAEEKGQEKQQTDASRGHHQAGSVLFGADVSYAKLASLLSQGWAIRATGLTEKFDIYDYYKTYGRHVIPLFGIDRRGRLRPFIATRELKPTAGWTIIGLVQYKEVEQDPQAVAEKSEQSSDQNQDDQSALSSGRPSG